MEYKKGRLKVDTDTGEIEINKNDIVCPGIGYTTGDFPIRSKGDFQYRGWYLDDTYDWLIVKDEAGELALIRLKKGVV